jgi:hypothetical protein
MKIQISHVNRDKGYIYSKYEEKLDKQDRGCLFRRLSREFGRCSSKVYVGEGTPVGWVFEKKALYDDTRETYIMETWVTITEERHVALDDMEAA